MENSDPRVIGLKKATGGPFCMKLIFSLTCRCALEFMFLQKDYEQ